MIPVSRRHTLFLMAAAVGPRATAEPTRPEGKGALWADDLRVDHRPRPAGIVAVRPRFSWTLVARDPLQRRLAQSAARVQVFTPASAVLFDSGRIAGTEPLLLPADDVPLPPQAPLRWRVRVWDQAGRPGPWSPLAEFVTGTAADWAAGWIAAEADAAITAPPSEAAPPPTSAYLLPLLRRAFRIERPVRHAVVCFAGLGAHALSVNGHTAGEARLNPGWTDYRKTVLYETLDITELLRVGDNVLGVRLGGGMYDVQGAPGRFSKFIGSFGAPKLTLQLRIVHTDGSERWIVSDADWRSRPGPIVFSSIYGGEDHDARREHDGWDRPALQDSAEWRPVLRTVGPGGALRPQPMPGLTVISVVPTVAVTHPAPGVAVHDLGRNLAGVPRLQVRGTAGTAIRLKPGELLDEQGRVTQASMGVGADTAIRFSYTLADAPGVQTWTPRFSYTGFRYLEVEGGEIVALDAERLRAGLATVGTFRCSDPQLNAIHDLIRDAVLSNAATVLTDCPHREKLGWLEQTWLNAPAVFHTLDAWPLYAKLVDDIADAQQDSGMVPSIAPEYIRFVDAAGHDTPFRHSPEWGSAVVQSAWAAYRYTGDTALLRRGYTAMCRYAGYLEASAAGGLLDVGLGDWYDIGSGPPGPAQLTSRAFTGSAVWYADVVVLVRIAALLGHGDDAAAYTARAQTLRSRINARFFDQANARYDRGSQTASAMALALGLVPQASQARVLAMLVEAIEARSDHVSSGDIGFRFVVDALAAAGRDDVLARLLARTDAPSYGAQLQRGATTLTEAWDANPRSSQNHFMLGHALPWLYVGLAGIDVDFQRAPDDTLIVAPKPVGGVTEVAASLATALGVVHSAWRIADGAFRLELTVPPGCVARVQMPGSDVRRLSLHGLPARGHPDVLEPSQRPGPAALRVGSGRYVFVAPWTAR